MPSIDAGEGPTLRTAMLDNAGSGAGRNTTTMDARSVPAWSTATMRADPEAVEATVAVVCPRTSVAVNGWVITVAG